MRLFRRMVFLEHVCFEHGCFEQQTSRQKFPNDHVTKQTCFKVLPRNKENNNESECLQTVFRPQRLTKMRVNSLKNGIRIAVDGIPSNNRLRRK